MEQDTQPLFVIDDDPIVDWPVIVRLPEAGGAFGEYRFTVQMRVLPAAEYEALFEQASNASEHAGARTEALSAILRANVPVFQRLITGWKEVCDRAGHPVPFSPEKLAEQVTGPRGAALSVGIWRAVNEVRHGARLGN